MRTLAPQDADDRTNAPHSVLPDEEALRRLFDEQFEILVRRARAELGEAAAVAPRVVEHVFEEAWQERRRFWSRGALDAFLDEELHHGVARAKSRRAAAHRLGHHDEDATAKAGAPAPPAVPLDAPVNREESWEHVQRALFGGGPSAEARQQAVAQQRHDAAAHVAGIARRRISWVPIAIAAVALVLVVAGIRWADSRGRDSAAQRAVSAQDARLVMSPRAQSARVTLVDQTEVRLAPESRLAIPTDFGPRLRAVKLEGAGTFSPSPGQEFPFSVHARDVIVEAIGTDFVVGAWPGDELVTVRVKSGTVRVRAPKGTSELAAGSSLVVGADGTPRAPTPAEQERVFAWMDGILVVEDRPLRDVLPMLNRWYALAIGVAVPDSALLDRRVTLRVPTASAKEAIAAIESQAKVVYSRNKARELLFRDAGAPPPKP